MSTEEIYDILTKKDIPPTQIAIFKCLRDARPLGCTRQDLADQMRDGNIRGVHGILLALSQRISGANDTDCPEFFNKHADYSTLRPALWQAICEIPELQAAVETMTVTEIYATYGQDDKARWLQPA
jgi:hypothetical protein